ncbi:ribose-phosphate diphosphokinase [Kangiella sediminilitoris]|uniref:ribose-phosphate diphosphokinase n=1 Tax=Kangiella sediminilitoris TaxID=1144748 RepID=A0A1B3BAQ7_9GAMM|nr:ribose-phosphate diphosphokinase [Kangiella sediminilitoris]AOE49861.1 Ribose-phosphate pyrophosphokinase [Kangiella sediminilitoris]
MNPLFLDLSGNLNLSAKIRHRIGADLGELHIRSFPDGESSMALKSEVHGRSIVIMTDLSHPNEKVLPLFLLTRILRERKAQEIILIAPYLPYMRQDAEFKLGESKLAKHFASLMSDHVDKLITVEPHLHRIHDLNDIFTIPTANAHSRQSVVEWIIKHIDNPVIIGPDMESTQWVAPVAGELSQPYLVAEKMRKGDKDVSIFIDGLNDYREYTPVVIDDIISTGFTMAGIGEHLKFEGFDNSVCIATHAIFVEDAYLRLTQSQFAQVVTTNTIPHMSNQVDVSEEISRAYASLVT